MFSYQFEPICDVPYNKNPEFVKIYYWEDDDKTFVNFSFNDGCKFQKKICLRQGGWLITFDNKIFKGLPYHKEFDNYMKANSDLLEQIQCKK